MGGNGKPKPLNLPEAETPPPATSRPKPLDLNDAQPASGAATKPRSLNIPDAAPPAPQEEKRPRTLNIADAPTPAPQPDRAPRTLNIPDAPTPPPRPATPAPRPQPYRPNTSPLAQASNPKVAACIAKAQQIEPTVQEHRIKGRIDTILKMSVTELLDFGNRNLDPLQDTSARKAQIAGEMSRIDATGWIERTKDASCKPPSFMDRINPPKPPSYFEGMLKKTRAELIAFVGELEKMKNTFFREITDLHLDAIAMIVCSECFDDAHAQMTANNRGRTLLAAHQTAAVIQTTIEQSMMICSQNIQTIDQLLSVTLPNWKAANGHP